MNSRADRADLLIELGCEELPPTVLSDIAGVWFDAVCDGLAAAQIAFDKDGSALFYTPRRLAMRIRDAETRQPDQTLQRRGPAVSAAFDSNGKPTKAAEGFARSVGKTVDELDTLKTDKGEWLHCEVRQSGKPLGELIYPILQQAIKRLPVPKPMRWADHDFSFIRPVHWLVLLHGEQVVDGELLGCRAGRVTYGHRVHAPGPHTLDGAADYEQTLLDAFVVADPEKRIKRIRQSIEAFDRDSESYTPIKPALLYEVGNLVEWPVAVQCTFDPAFLSVPTEALVSSMEKHQKFFPVLTHEDGQLCNRFITMTNLQSQDTDQVREGFERVIRPRLADAQFFWEQDKKQPFSHYRERLNGIVFQNKLGSVGDKCDRIAEISEKIASDLGLAADSVTRAAQLCKCDLVTEMVGEFPDLQGVMGRYYALAADEEPAVAEAIEQHYWPRFSGDKVPTGDAGRILALADRLDTLAGIFAIGQKPSGNKDPFALRRAALGIARIVQEGQMDLGLGRLFETAVGALGRQQAGLIAEPQDLTEALRAFTLDRLKAHYREDRGYSAELFQAVVQAQDDHLPDFDRRIGALAAFAQREEAQSLAAANKRIGNILRKANPDDLGENNEIKLSLSQEKNLYTILEDVESGVEQHCRRGDYGQALDRLASLKAPVDQFFDEVMVMDEDRTVRRSRLALIGRIKAAFDQIADLSRLG